MIGSATSSDALNGSIPNVSLKPRDEDRKTERVEAYRQERGIVVERRQRLLLLTRDASHFVEDRLFRRHGGNPCRYFGDPIVPSVSGTTRVFEQGEHAVP